MASPKSEPPVIKNPVLHTLEAYAGKNVRVVQEDGTTTEGTLAVVQEKLIILHVRGDHGHLDPFGIYSENIDTIQEISRPLRVVS